MDFEIQRQRGLMDAVLRIIAVNRGYESRKDYLSTPLNTPMLCQTMIQRASATLICGMRALVNAEGEQAQITSLMKTLLEDTQDNLFEPLQEDEEKCFDGILNHLIAEGSGVQSFDPCALALTNGRTMEDYLSDYLLSANRKFFNQEEAFLALANFYHNGYESSHYSDFKAYQSSVIDLSDVIPDQKFSTQIKNRITQYIDNVESDSD